MTMYMWSIMYKSVMEKKRFAKLPNPGKILTFHCKDYLKKPKQTET